MSRNYYTIRGEWTGSEYRVELDGPSTVWVYCGYEIVAGPIWGPLWWVRWRAERTVRRIENRAWKLYQFTEGGDR